MHTSRFLTFCLIVVTYVLSTVSTDDKTYVICKTDECVNTAANIRSNLNLNATPCDDFYQFACGGWIADNQLTSSESRKTKFLIVDKIVAERIKEMLEGTQQPTDTVALGYAREMYSMCINNDISDSDGIAALDKFSQRFGAWPITLPISEWNADDVSWQEMTKKMHDNFFENGLFAVRIEINPHKSDSHVISLDQPRLFLMYRAMYESLDSDIQKKEAYTKYIETIAQMFAQNRESGADKNIIAEDARNIVDFEINFAKGIKDIAEISEMDNSHTFPTIKEWQEIYNKNVNNNEKTGINWYDLLQDIFRPLGITISESDIVMIPTWSFFSDLVSLLDRTPIRTIVNYMQWNFIRQQTVYTTVNLEELSKRFKETIGLEPEPEEKWKACMEKFACVISSECSVTLNTVISYEYAKRYEQKEGKNNVKEMVSDIADAIREQISTSTWMDKKTKEVSIDKLNHMAFHVSTPDWYSKEAIDELYNDLNITPKTGYLDNMLKLQIDKRKLVLSRLRKPVDDKNTWVDYPPVSLNAFYVAETNAIFIMLSLLQDPVYNVTHPMVMNYAAIGSIIGHEINHGFDSFGSRYDKDGNKVSWWSEDAIDNFKPITQCFIDQFNGYEVPGLDEVVYVQGNLAVGENLGDTAGTTAAFKAYKNRKARLQQPDTRLSGLEEYSEDQIFFLSYAQMMCENISPQLIKLYLSDAHPIMELRIRGTLSNMAEFSEAYKCSNTAKLNPVNKCNLWK